MLRRSALLAALALALAGGVCAWASPLAFGPDDALPQIPTKAELSQHFGGTWLLTGAERPELPLEPMATLDEPGADPHGVLPEDAPSTPPCAASMGYPRDVVMLSAPPTALLLFLQGLACIALFRGRRKWAALAVAVLSVGRSGISALPRFVAVQKAKRPASAAPAERVQRAASGLSVLSRSPALDFVGLLRRLDGDGGDASASSAQRRASDHHDTFAPAVSVGSAQLFAGFVAQFADLAHPVVVPGCAPSALQPFGTDPLPAIQAIPFPVLARPPPLAA